MVGQTLGCSVTRTPIKRQNACSEGRVRELVPASPLPVPTVRAWPGGSRRVEGGRGERRLLMRLRRLGNARTLVRRKPIQPRPGVRTL